jgi:ATP-dependent Clp protease ATP-binding subunit ClpA
VMGIHEGSHASISMDAIKRTFTPEFLNRLDAVVHFDKLPENVMLEVVRKFLGDLEKQLAKKKIEISASEDALKWLLKKGFDPQYGARPLARTIDEHVKKPLVDEILFGKLEKGGKVQVDVKDDKPVFEFA